MTLPTPFFQTELGTLYHGDCLEILPCIEQAGCVVTDPPFAFAGGLSNGMSSTADAQFFKTWWSIACPLITKSVGQHGSGFLWCDWRTIKIFADGFAPKLQTYDFFKTQALYHFRKMPGMGKPFRSSVDLILYFRGPKSDLNKIPTNTLNFIEEYWYYGKHEFHPAEKSTSVCAKLLSYCDGPCLDPFFGSGTTAVACERLGRKWIGIEISLDYCRLAKKRIENEIAQKKLPGF